MIWKSGTWKMMIGEMMYMTVNSFLFGENEHESINPILNTENVLNRKIQAYRHMSAEEYLKEKLGKHKLFIETT